jgi:putative FmdB family regulatory protein
MPILSFECLDCHKQYDSLVRNEDDKQHLECPSCHSENWQQCLTYPSNYEIKGNNSASVRPKRMGGT